MTTAAAGTGRMPWWSPALARRRGWLAAVACHVAWMSMAAMAIPRAALNESQAFVEQPRWREAPERPFFWNHIGKAGGGTVDDILRRPADLGDPSSWAQWKKAVVTHCHPNPCVKEWVPLTDTGQGVGVIVVIRDPVDRFVSAFDWRALVSCTPGDRRKPSQGQPDDFQSSCKGARDDFAKNEVKILHEVYKGDANALAESLCVRGPDTQKTARKHWRQIGHAQHTIADWLGGKTGLERLKVCAIDSRCPIITLPLEPHFDFVEMIKSGLSAAVASWSGAQRHRRGNISTVMLHSSVGNGHHSSLSPAGECCLAQEFHDEYPIIEWLAKVGCRGDRAAECVAALTSMVDRRRSLLTASCSELDTAR